MRTRAVEPELVTLRLPARGSRTAARAAGRERSRDRLVTLAFAALVVGAFGVLLRMGREMGFYYDEWDFILDRRGISADTLLSPHNEHLSLVPVLIYKVLLQVFGFGGYLAFRVVGLVILLSCAVLVFALARRHVAPVTALLLTAPLLLMGQAHHALFAPFQMTLHLSLALGLGALLALDHGSRRGDLAACGLLVVATATSGVGLFMAVGAAAAILLRPGGRRRLWVVGVPLALYAVWWVGYGAESQDYRRLGDALSFVFNSTAATVAAYTALDWGQALAVALAAAVVLRIVRLGGVPLRTVSVLAALVSFWFATGLVRADYAASRYLIVSASLLVCALAPLLPARPPSSLAIAGGAAAAAIVLLMGSTTLINGRQNLLLGTVPAKVRLAAVEVAADRVDPAFEPDTGRMPTLTARQYLQGVRDFGSPAMPLRDVRRREPPMRYEFDAALIAAERIALAAPAPGRATGPAPTVQGGQAKPSGASCVASDGKPVALQLPPAGVRLTAPDDGELVVRLRRLGDDLPLQWSQKVPAGESRDLRLGPDRLPDPWRATLEGPAGALACGLPPA